MEKKQFKGWGVLAAAFILSFIPTAIMSNCFSLYMAPVCSDLGFSNTSWSMVNLISSFASAIGAMVIAGLYQKKNMKLMMVIVTVGTGLCWFIATFCTAIWQFYILFGLSNVFMAGLTQLPISMLITAWFEDKRATMMSIAYAGGGLGGAVWSPVISGFIAADATGWKTAMIFSAVVVRFPFSISLMEFLAAPKKSAKSCCVSWLAILASFTRCPNCPFENINSP